MLSIQSFRKDYSGKLILTCDQLEFPEGIHWIKGANGSGKSSLFKCIAGLSPFEGKIACHGIDLKKSPVDYKRVVNYAQAEPVFPESLHGIHVFEYFSKLKKSSKNQSKELELKFGLEPFINEPIKAYSSGMTKKLALAIAFLGNPKLIILDEPFNALDVASRQTLFNLIEERLEEGCSFLLSTHHDFGSELDLKTRNWIVSNKTIREE
ncbi:ABC transporter ATP-binding protein [Roseivirga sp.]|uniref:ABC transporter ATP-binding protein n=1 Tax=Roseivirga sp. TaxID=1964215 RepID=UPI003B51626C